MTGNVVRLKDFVPPRPKGIPDHVSAEQLVEAVQGWILGDTPDQVATKLDISRSHLITLQRTADWREIQNFVRDEFMLGTGARLMRIEHKLLDKIETSLDNGIEVVSYNDAGDEFRHHRQMTPKEMVSVALMMNEVNKRVDKAKSGDVTRKTFDPDGWRRILEKAAKAMNEKEVPGTATREPD